MKSYSKLKTEIKVIQQLMFGAKKNVCANALKKAKRRCENFGFTAGMQKGSFVESRRSK